jgi:hypothetical protein
MKFTLSVTLSALAVASRTFAADLEVSHLSTQNDMKINVFGCRIARTLITANNNRPRSKE